MVQDAGTAPPRSSEGGLVIGRPSVPKGGLRTIRAQLMIPARITAVELEVFGALLQKLPAPANEN